MKRALIVLIASVSSAMMQAQNPENTPFEKEVELGTGLGLSLFSSFAELVEFGADGTITDTRSSMANTGYFTYRPRHFFSFGLAGGSQYIEQTVEDFSFTVNDKDYFVESFKYRVTRTNIGFLIGIHYLQRADVDVYSTLRAGWSVFSIKPEVNDTQLANELEKRALFSFSTPAFQTTLIGVRYYPLKYFGFHLEAGLGAPTYLSAGISGRIPAGPEKIKAPKGNFK